MSAEYQLTATNAIVIRNADKANIPNDPRNPDWQAYQAWLTAGGVPDPYVPPPTEQTVPTVVIWTDEYSSGVTAAAARRAKRSASGPAPAPQAAPAKITWNTPGQADATQIEIARVNGKSSDMSSMLLSALQPGRLLRIEARANAEGQFTSHRIVSATKSASGIVVTVTPVASASAPFGNNAALNLGVFQ